MDRDTYMYTMDIDLRSLHTTTCSEKREGENTQIALFMSHLKL